MGALSWPWLSQPPRPHLRPLPLLRLRLIPGTDTTADGDTEATTGLMATTATMERDLLRPSPLLRLLLPLRPRLIPGTDTTAMATGLMATTGLMAMDTGLMAMDTTDIGLMAM